MKVRIMKSAKDILLEYAFEEYGKMVREIDSLAEMDLVDVEETIKKIILTYLPPEIRTKYRVVVKPSSRCIFDYDVQLKKKRNPEKA